MSDIGSSSGRLSGFFFFPFLPSKDKTLNRIEMDVIVRILLVELDHLWLTDLWLELYDQASFQGTHLLEKIS